METEVASNVKSKIQNGDWKRDATETKLTNEEWEEFLTKELAEVSNPRLFLYELIHQSGIDWMPSPFTVLTGFQLWFNKQDNPGSIEKDQFANILSKFYDYKANNVATMIFDIFGAKERPANELIQVLKQKLFSQSKIDYEKASKMVVYLDKRDVFDFDEVVLPLMLSNASVNDLVKYLKPGKDEIYLEDQAKQLVKWLDNFNPANEKHIEEDFKNKCRRFNINRLKDAKNREKLLMSLIKDMKMELEKDAPKAFYHQVGKHLRWLIADQINQLDRITWRDNVKDKVGSYPDIHPKLIELLIKNNFKEEALFWMQELKIDPKTLKDDIKKEVEQAKEAGLKPEKIEEIDQKIDDKHYQLPFKKEIEIVDVDSPDALQEVLRHLADAGGINAAMDIVGLDCEFAADSNNVSSAVLMQIAGRDKIYLIDLISKKISEDNWTEFLKELFGEGCKHTFLGYDFRSDLSALNKTSHVFENLGDLMKGKLLDIKIFSDRAFEAGFISGLPENDDGKFKGLTGLTERALGLPLNKGQQMSVWTNRPLREPQRKYAAIDAYVLIQIYDTLYEKSGNKSDNLKSLQSDLLANKTPSKSPKTTQQPATIPEDKIEAVVAPHEEKSPPQFKAVTDGMLEESSHSDSRKKRKKSKGFRRMFSKCFHSKTSD